MNDEPVREYAQTCTLESALDKTVTVIIDTCDPRYVDLSRLEHDQIARRTDRNGNEGRTPETRLD